MGSSGAVVGGWGGWPKSADQCKRMCESRKSCIGYTAVTTGGTGTCYVHGHFTETRPSGWFDANGNVYEIGRASGHYNLACYKRVWKLALPFHLLSYYEWIQRERVFFAFELLT